MVTWETQQTDYPRTRPGLQPQPRGCARGASYSWYFYSANRVKHPLMRKRLLRLWRAAKAEHGDPVAAWASIQADEAKRREYQKVRGLEQLRAGGVGGGGGRNILLCKLATSFQKYLALLLFVIIYFLA